MEANSGSNATDNCLKEEEIDEEEKMEKFYELIKRLKEARDYQRSLLQAREQDHQKILEKTEGSDRDRKPGWVPTFEWEDFRGVRDVNFRIKDNHVVVVASDRDNRPPSTPHQTEAPAICCSNCVHVYFNGEICGERKRRKISSSVNDEEEIEIRKVESDNITPATGLDLNLSL